jgi:hypothetical protein
MKQTAVEWLVDEWLHLDAEFDMVLIDRNTYWEKLKEIQRQALEMEEEQHGYNWVNCKKIIYEGFVYIKYSDLLECEKSFNNCT